MLEKWAARARLVFPQPVMYFCDPRLAARATETIKNEASIMAGAKVRQRKMSFERLSRAKLR